MNHITAATIRQLMRKHRKTIKGIAQTWGLTQKRVREVRDNGVKGEHFVMDWMQILTGDPYAGWDAIAAAYTNAAAVRAARQSHPGDDAPAGKQDHPRADAHPVAAADARPAEAVSVADRPAPAAVFMGGRNSGAARATGGGHSGDPRQISAPVDIRRAGIAPPAPSALIHKIRAPSFFVPSHSFL